MTYDERKTKLKPCPFCGKKPKRIKATIPGKIDSIICNNPYCELWDSFSEKAWNRRAKTKLSHLSKRLRRRKKGLTI